MRRGEINLGVNCLGFKFFGGTVANESDAEDADHDGCGFGDGGTMNIKSTL